MLQGHASSEMLYSSVLGATTYVANALGLVVYSANLSVLLAELHQRQHLWGLVFRVWDLRFGVGFGISGLGFRVWGTTSKQISLFKNIKGLTTNCAGKALG